MLLGYGWMHLSIAGNLRYQVRGVRFSSTARATDTLLNTHIEIYILLSTLDKRRLYSYEF